MVDKAESFFSWVGRQRQKSRAELELGLRRRVREAFRPWFSIPRWSALPIYTTYLPESLYFGWQKRAFHSLVKRFCAHNAGNGGDLPRLIAFMLNIEQVLKEGVLGDFAELGVWRGNTAAVLAHYATAGGRKTILFDTFSGFDTRDLTGIDAGQGIYFWDTSMALVEDVVGCVGSVEYVKGYFPDTIGEGHRERRYAVVSLDCDLYAPMKAGLEFFYPRMSKGALFLLHDYSGGVWSGCVKAVDEFCAASGEQVVLMPDAAGSAIIRKAKE
jgi:Macrocin-O-methyltransferase (TylF)